MTTLIEVFWKSGAALGAALLINVLLRKKSADVRRVVLSTVVVAMFLAVLALPILPRWTAITPSWLSSVEAPPVFPIAARISQHATQTPTIPLMPAATPHPTATITNRIPGTIPLLWFFGSILLLTRFAVGLYGLRRIRNASKPVTDPAVLASLENLCARGVMLLQNDAIAAPVTWGIFRPVVLVPTGFGELAPECRRAVLCHEIAHVRNSDFFLRSLSEIARALIWFQPLMWIVARQLREEQELACDDRVLADGGKPSAYAKLLLEWDLRPGMDSLVAVGIAHRSSLKRRLYSLLDQEQCRERAAGTVVFVTCLLGLALAFPLAAISFTRPAAPPAKVPQTYQSATPEPPRSLPPARIPATPRTRIQLAQAIPASAVPRPSAQVVPTALFVSSTVLVVTPVIVTGQDGRSIEGLTADDFVITEDDKSVRASLAEYQKIADPQVASYYVVGYYTTNSKQDGAYRTLKISLKNNSAILRHRAGYFGSTLTPVGTYEPVNTSSAVRPPTLVLKVEAEYTDEARKAKYSGTVSLNVDVDDSGKPTNIVVVQPLGMGLDQTAVAAVTRWRFNPAVKDGVRVAAPVRVWMSFRLF